MVKTEEVVCPHAALQVQFFISVGSGSRRCCRVHLRAVSLQPFVSNVISSPQGHVGCCKAPLDGCVMLKSTSTVQRSVGAGADIRFPWQTSCRLSLVKPSSRLSLPGLLQSVTALSRYQFNTSCGTGLQFTLGHCITTKWPGIERVRSRLLVLLLAYCCSCRYVTNTRFVQILEKFGKSWILKWKFSRPSIVWKMIRGIEKSGKILENYEVDLENIAFHCSG